MTVTAVSTIKPQPNLRELATAASALRSNDLLGRPDNYPETVAARTNALTTAQLDAAAKAAIDPSRFVWVVVGDASVVKPQLDALGIPVEVRAAATQ